MDRSELSPEEFDRWVATEPSGGTDVSDVEEPEWLKAGPASPPVRTPVARTANSDAPTPPTRRRRRGGVIAVVAALVVAGALAAAGLALNSSDPEPDSVAAEPAAPAVEDTTWCEGLGAGAPATTESEDPGAAAIAGFERAYYVLRDGRRAREHVAPDGRVGTAEQLDEGIRQIPVGTNHCVLVRKATEGAYSVDVFERRPDGTVEHYPQTVMTVTTPDGTRITAIKSREG